MIDGGGYNCQLICSSASRDCGRWNGLGEHCGCRRSKIRDRIQFHLTGRLERMFGGQLFECCSNSCVLIRRYPRHQFVAFGGRDKDHVGERGNKQRSRVGRPDR